MFHPLYYRVCLILEGKLSIFIMNLGFPIWIHDMLVYGLFRVTGWVISVMLPPMAIFFPMFTFRRFRVLT